MIASLRLLPARDVDRPAYEEHNLFPFEIAFLWVIGSLPLLAGIVAGAYSRRRKR